MMYVFEMLSIMLVMNGEEVFLIGMESTLYLCMGLPSRGCLPGRFRMPVLWFELQAGHGVCCVNDA